MIYFKTANNKYFILQNIFKSENCQTDYLEIRDGYWHKSPLIARFCGKVQTEILTTVSSRMLLTYVNMHRAEGFRGFKAEFDGKQFLTFIIL